MKTEKILIAPSLLSADFGSLNADIDSVEPFVDLIHVDVMDGHFVPNITFGPPVIARIKSRRPLDVHLMIEHPDQYLSDFAKAMKRAYRPFKHSTITVHQETCPHLHRVIQQIKKLGCRAAVALNPATPLSTIEPMLLDFDMVLLMTVNPGFGGQTFIESVLPKIELLRRKAPKLDIEVDGGINEKTAKLAVQAGANILVAGSYIFGEQNRQKKIESLK